MYEKAKKLNSLSSRNRLIMLSSYWGPG